MRRFIVCTVFAVVIAGCKSDDSDDDDEDFATWASGGAQDLPGGATDLPNDDDDDDDDDDPDGDLGGLDGGSSGGSGGGSGGSSGGGGTTGSGTGSGSTDAYAGGYPINPCASTPAATGMSVGDISPDWALQDQYGESVRLSDFCGSVVLMESVAFW